jgi:hypothetical protein
VLSAPTLYSPITSPVTSNNTEANVWPLCKSISNVTAVAEPRSIRLEQHRRYPGSRPFSPPFSNSVTFNTKLARPTEAQASLRYRQQASNRSNIMPCGIGGNKTTQRKLVLLYAFPLPFDWCRARGAVA